MRKSLVFILLALTLVTPNTMAATGITMSMDNPIPDAMGLFLSNPKGQDVLLHDQLEHILWNYGMSFKSGHFKELSLIPDQEIDLNSLPPEYKKYEDTLHDIKSAIKKWTQNYSMKNPKLEMKIKDIGFSLKLSHMSLLPDYNLFAKSGERDGAILVLKLVIPDIKVNIRAIVAKDTNNEILRSFGLTGITASLAPECRADQKADNILVPDCVEKKQDLVITVPLLIKIDGDGKLIAQTFSKKNNDKEDPKNPNPLFINTNTSALQIILGYEKKVLPQLTLMVADSADAKDFDENYKSKKPDAIKFTTDHIDDIFKKNHSKLVKITQTYLEKFIQTQFSREFNGFLSKISHVIRDVSQMPPPGVPKGTKEELGFRRSTKLDEVVQTDKYLGFRFSGYVEDPEKTTPAIVSKDTHRHAEPKLASDQYDYAFSLNQNYINRIVQLSFNRGYFENIVVKTEKIKKDDGTEEIKQKYIGLDKPPALQFDDSLCKRGQLDTKFRTRLKIFHHAVGFWEDVAFDKLTASVDLLFRLKPVPGGIAVIYDSFDLSTLNVEDKTIRFGFGWKVKGNIKGTLAEENKTYASKESIAIAKIPIPPNFTGIPAQLHTICSDGSGHLMMYLDKMGGK
ncbi:MAG: hypothetical protein SGI74_03255 [Oligoflexia bacterium]|nr:hypothetical protein [Oligoflexia bacterium]